MNIQDYTIMYTTNQNMKFYCRKCKADISMGHYFYLNELIELANKHHNAGHPKSEMRAVLALS